MQKFSRLLILIVAALVINPLSNAESLQGAPANSHAVQAAEKISPYLARFGRSRPVIAVVGENSGTVLSDFVIPYGVLARTGIAEVVSVATQPGLLRLEPLQIKPDHTVSDFDLRFPDGADYVFVPAVEKRDDPTLIAWVASQAAKGATMISICNGSIVLANAGLTRGHRATGHWSTYRTRVEKYPDTQWVKNIRYVVDGKLISSAGITAAIPTSLALVEAIAGTEHAVTLAKQLGVDGWGTQHNSDAFNIVFSDYVKGFTNTFFHHTDTIGVPIFEGVDEIALALTADAYSATLRSHVYALGQSNAAIKTLSGLMLVPNKVIGQGPQLDRILPEWVAVPPMQALDQAIEDINKKYGPSTARFVMLEGEYSKPVSKRE